MLGDRKQEASVTRPIDPQIRPEDGAQELPFGRTRKRFRIPRVETPILVLAGGLVLVLFLFILLAPRQEMSSRSSASAETLAQLDQVTERLHRIEVALTSLEERIDALPVTDTTDAIRVLSRNLDRRIGGLERTLETMKTAPLLAAAKEKKAVLPAPAKPIASSVKVKKVVVEKPSVRTPASRVHVVRKGDTLYGISRKYKIGVSQLQRANGLTVKAAIHPGQKLTIP